MWKYKILNKKSQVEDWLPLILLVIILVFVFFITMLLKIGGEREQSKLFELEQNKINTQQLLLNYLRSPFSPDKNMADAINEFFITKDRDLFDKIETKTKNFFSGSEMESDFYSWQLNIVFPDNKEFSINPIQLVISIKELAEINIPGFNPTQPIKLKLFLLQIRKGS